MRLLLNQACPTITWQQHLKAAIRCPQALAERLQLPASAISTEQAGGNFPLFVPLPYLSRIQIGDPTDPLLRQVLPVNDESAQHIGFSQDPLDESNFKPVPGLLQKYRSRALMIVTGACAVHCRYCFRRHFPYDQTDGLTTKWEGALQQVQRDESIREVILSGGDPLTIVDQQMEFLVKRIAEIGHVTRLRIHTRLPIVIPQRVTAALVQLLSASRLTAVVVVHCNHANEIDESVERAMRWMSSNSISVLNQAVLLRGVNDDVDALTALSERLIDVGVIPYYLHQLDPVEGAAHFHVDVQRGLELIEQMRRSLSGYLVPKYVREIPGQPYKTLLT